MPICQTFVVYSLVDVILVFMHYQEYIMGTLYTLGSHVQSAPTALIISHQSTQITESFEQCHRTLRPHFSQHIA